MFRVLLSLVFCLLFLGCSTFSKPDDPNRLPSSVTPDMVNELCSTSTTNISEKFHQEFEFLINTLNVPSLKAKIVGEYDRNKALAAEFNKTLASEETRELLSLMAQVRDQAGEELRQRFETEYEEMSKLLKSERLHAYLLSSYWEKSIREKIVHQLESNPPPFLKKYPELRLSYVGQTAAGATRLVFFNGPVMSRLGSRPQIHSVILEVDEIGPTIIVRSPSYLVEVSTNTWVSFSFVPLSIHGALPTSIENSMTMNMLGNSYINFSNNYSEILSIENLCKNLDQPAEDSKSKEDI